MTLEQATLELCKPSEKITMRMQYNPASKFTALFPVVEYLKTSELQKSHGYAGITREEGLQNGQSVRKVSCQHAT